MSASPSSGVNTLTGEGLAEALAGAQVVVDVSNSPSWADAAVMEFFDTSTRNLLAAEKAAGVGHHVALSVVGADRMPDSGYMRAKVNQEKLIEAGGVPYTIVRATQFFEFLGGIADSGAEGDTVRLSTAPMQPLAADDVAAALADVAVGAPLNGMVELAGPESDVHRRVRRAIPWPRAGTSGRWSRTRRPVTTGAAMDERGIAPGSESASRPDAVRGLVRPRRHGQRRSGPLEGVVLSDPVIVLSLSRVHGDDLHTHLASDGHAAAAAHPLDAPLAEGETCELLDLADETNRRLAESREIPGGQRLAGLSVRGRRGGCEPGEHGTDGLRISLVGAALSWTCWNPIQPTRPRVSFHSSSPSGPRNTGIRSSGTPAAARRTAHNPRSTRRNGSDRGVDHAGRAPD